VKSVNSLNDVKNEILKEYLEPPFSTIQEICKKHNLSLTSVYRFFRGMGVVRNHSEAALLRCNKQLEWRRLTRVRDGKHRKSNTRLVSIPESTIKSSGVNPNKEIVAKWNSVKDGRLILELKEVEN